MADLNDRAKPLLNQKILELALSLGSAEDLRVEIINPETADSAVQGV